MSVATTTILGIGAIAAGAGGAIASGVAAHGQTEAAKSAAELQHEDAKAALDFQKKEYADTQFNQAPWISAGKGAITTLSGLLGTGQGGLLQPWDQTFTAPTQEQAANDPGYEFTVAQGVDALDKSAAARGTLLTGSQGTDLLKYGQAMGSQQYDKVYNRSLGEYQQAYNIFKQNQADTYNRLAGVAGIGQTAVGQLGSEGQAASNNVSNILLGSGQQIGDTMQQAAAARGSGYVGISNALSNGIGSYGNYALMSQLLNNNSFTPMVENDQYSNYLPS